MRKTVLCLSGIALFAACDELGAADAPILDGVPNASYEQDVTACTALAEDASSNPTEVGVATTAGALVGGLAAGHEDTDAAPWGALLGAAAGWIGMQSDQQQERRAILVACLQGRGHPVVG